MRKHLIKMYRSSYKNVQIISTPGFRGLLIFANEKKNRIFAE